MQPKSGVPTAWWLGEGLEINVFGIVLGFVGFFLSFILLTVHLDVILVNNQLDAPFSKCIYFYFTPLHVSSSKRSSSGGSVCINTPSGTTYSSG